MTRRGSVTIELTYHYDFSDDGDAAELVEAEVSGARLSEKALRRMLQALYVDEQQRLTDAAFAESEPMPNHEPDSEVA